MEFEVITIKNCKRHIKKCYTLPIPIDSSLIEFLGEYGQLQRITFSQYNPNAKDYFKIQFETFYQLDGVLNGYDLYFTISKDSLEFTEEIENRIKFWLTHNQQKKPSAS